MRKDKNGTFKVGNPSVQIDDNSDIHIGKKRFVGTKGLYELLTRKNVNLDAVTTHDLRKYKQILELKSAHLEKYNPAGDLKLSRSSKFRDVIAVLFPVNTRRRSVESALRRTWIRYK
jgi:hypothetical protein